MIVDGVAGDLVVVARRVGTRTLAAVRSGS
jgi:hypothetical protein